MGTPNQICNLGSNYNNNIYNKDSKLLNWCNGLMGYGINVLLHSILLLK